jgi:DNA polymerase III epsilon subunit-like protein
MTSMIPRPYTEPVSRLLALGPPREGWREPWQDLPTLCGLTPNDVPELIRLATEKAIYHFQEAFPDADFGPLHAWRALGQLGDEAAIAPLVALFTDEYTYEMGDDVCQVFTLFGEPAMPALEQLLVDQSQPAHAHLLAIQCLVKMGQELAPLRDRCVWVLGTLLERYQALLPEINAELVWGLADLNAKSYLPLIEAAYAAQKVDKQVVSLDMLYEMFNPPRDSYVPSFSEGVDIFDHHLPLPAPSLPLHRKLRPRRELMPAVYPPPEPEPLRGFLPAQPVLTGQPPAFSKTALPPPGDSDPPESLSLLETLLALEQTTHNRWPDYRQLGLKQAHIPALLATATDASLYARPYETPAGQAPYHALRALAQLGAAETLPSLLSLLLQHRHDDALHEDFPWLCSLIGPAAIPHLAAALPDLAQSKDTWYACASVSEGLASIGRAHPEARDQCVHILYRQLGQFAAQPEPVNTFLAYALVQLQAVSASLLLQQVWETPGAYGREYMMDWFAMQVHLGSLMPVEAAEQRQLYSLYRDWQIYKNDFWPGRDPSWLWPERADEPLIDQRHDFNRAGRVDRPRVRLRAARWAYSLLDGWRFGPFAVLAVETTGHPDKEAEIVQVGLVNETGRVLLDTLVRPLKEILPQATDQHGITSDMVADGPSFGDLYPQLKQCLRGRTLVVYDWERQGRLFREAMHNCSSSWPGIHLQDLGEQVAYFYGIVHEDGWPVERVLLGNACQQQGIPVASPRSAISHCRAMHALIVRMARWLQDYPDYIPHAPYPYSLLARSYQNPHWLVAF